MQLTRSGIAIAVLAVTFSCGKKKDDDESRVSITSVGGLSALPDASSVTSSTKASLTGDADSVTGTPPTLSSFSADNMEKYLTGTIADILTAMTTAKNSGDWTTIKTKADQFRESSAKCQQIEDVGRTMMILNENTSDLCYMAAVGKSGAGALEYVSGTTYEDGEIFKPGTDDRVVQITYGKDVRKFLIYGTTSVPTGYKVAFSRCVDSKPKDYSVVTVDSTAGTFVLSNTGSRPLKENMTADDFYFKLEGGIAYDDSTKAYIFDKTKDRTITAKNYRVDPTRSNTVVGILSVAADNILSKLFMKDVFDVKNREGTSVTQTEIRKAINYENFSGTTGDDIQVYQGAGYQYGSVSNSSLGSTAFERENTVGFEFDNTKTPQYNTVTTGDYVDKVKTLSAGIATLDPFTGLTAPGLPDALPEDATTLCAKTADTVVKAKPREDAVIVAIEKSCSDKRQLAKGRSLCDAIREGEVKVTQFLNDRRTAVPSASGKGN